MLYQPLKLILCIVYAGQYSATRMAVDVCIHCMQHLENIHTPSVCRGIRRLSFAALSAGVNGLCLLSVYLKFAIYMWEEVCCQRSVMLVTKYDCFFVSKHVS
jgi:hypothetical protein